MEVTIWVCWRCVICKLGETSVVTAEDKAGNNRRDFRLITCAVRIDLLGFFTLFCLESFLILLSKAELRVKWPEKEPSPNHSGFLWGWIAPPSLEFTELGGTVAPEWDGEGDQCAESGSVGGSRRKVKQRKERFYSLSFPGHFLALSSRCFSPAFSSFRDAFSKIRKFLMFKEWIKLFQLSEGGQNFFVFKSFSLAWSLPDFKDITESFGDSFSVSLLCLCWGSEYQFLWGCSLITDVHR